MRTLATLLGLSACVLLGSRAEAWTPLDNTYPRWPKMPVSYRINESTIPGSIAAFGKARLDQGLASWSTPSCTFFATQNLGNTNTTYNYNDGLNIFQWKSGTWPGELGDPNSVIGVTMPVWDNNAEIYDADIVYNNVGFCWNDNGSGNCVDTLSIATHEEGHFLGLGHTNTGGATMEAFYGGGNSIASIEQDDINGVCGLYPAPGSSSSSSGGTVNCDTCANSSADNECNSQYNACASSQQCIAFYQCLTSCGSQACADGCANQYPTGANLYGAYVNCACSVCSVECAAECGGSGSSSSSSSSGGTSSSGSTSSSGGTSSSGTGGGGGEGGTPGWTSDDDDPAPQPTSDGSCACSVKPTPLRFGAFLSAAVLALAWARRRGRQGQK